ncbi:MAG: acyl carrier protein [Candidatus Eisenbacteria bacterium]|nr:acyl carrier protein [Candidatus Eisenbacteria bacterium]
MSEAAFSVPNLSVAEVRSRVREFIIRNFYVPDPNELPDDASLLDRGIIDSTGVLEVIGFLEDDFHFRVEDSEMIPENLDSIERIVQFILRRTSN